MRLPSTLVAASQYFAPEPTAASRSAQVRLTLPDVVLTLRTDRGVFSPGHVDPGTKALLLDAAAPTDGAADLLDLGCGYGPIALTLACRAPAATVWALDVNARARALCEANAATAGLTNVRVVAPDDVPDHVRFAGIWSNPPIRVGKAALHLLLARWLDRLVEGGTAWLVVHKNLGSDSLGRWLAESGHVTRRVSSRAGYRVLEVSR